MIAGVQQRAENANSTQANADRQNTDVFDAGIGQHALKVRLSNNEHRGDSHGHQTEDNEQSLAELGFASGHAQRMHSQNAEESTVE